MLSAGRSWTGPIRHGVGRAGAEKASKIEVYHRVLPSPLRREETNDRDPDSEPDNCLSDQGANASPQHNAFEDDHDCNYNGPRGAYTQPHRLSDSCTVLQPDQRSSQGVPRGSVSETCRQVGRPMPGCGQSCVQRALPN